MIEDAVLCMDVAIPMIPHFFGYLKYFSPPYSSTPHPKIPPQIFQKWMLYSCNCFSLVRRIIYPSLVDLETILPPVSSSSTFGWDGFPPRSSPFLECSNLSDMASAKPGSECCIIIHDLRPSKPVDQHNSASLCEQCITWYTISLSIRHLGHLKWFSYFQRFTHLPTPHMPYDHFDSHCFFQIGRLFAACCNTDM